MILGDLYVMSQTTKISTPHQLRWACGNVLFICDLFWPILYVVHWIYTKDQAIDQPRWGHYFVMIALNFINKSIHHHHISNPCIRKLGQGKTKPTTVGLIQPCVRVFNICGLKARRNFFRCGWDPKLSGMVQEEPLDPLGKVSDKFWSQKASSVLTFKNFRQNHPSRSHNQIYRD